MSLLSTDVRHPLATKQGWASFVAQISPGAAPPAAGRGLEAAYAVRA